MSLFIAVAIAAAVAYLVGRPWAMAVPLGVGCIVAAVAIALGVPLNDTPLPFTVVVATIAAGFGVVIRRQRIAV